MIVAVLDACVLVPSVLADTLLRCAEQELYRSGLAGCRAIRFAHRVPRYLAEGH
ncbi:hypothetical protein [Micromonospora haikouensis]|uniref:hypothetical protein n=1 Tax=Micromonospora haikouensis TaxID=686309 RepID=UPI003D8B49D9